MKDTWGNLSSQQLQWLQQPFDGTPKALKKIREDMQGYIDTDTRLLIYKGDNSTVQNAVVVSLTKTYPRFAVGYVLNKLGGNGEGTKIPYTINYSSLFDKQNRTHIKAEQK